MCFSQPSLPPPAPPPARDVSPDVIEARKRIRQQAANAFGMGQTFSNGAGGLMSTPVTSAKTLLGR